MNAIHLLSVVSRRGHSGAQQPEVSLEMLDDLAAELARIFQVSCHVHEEPFPADFAYDARRDQYYSTFLLQHMQSLARDPHTAWLGVTGLDLFIPILTYLFGEAQLGGRCALVSLHRLREEFYGLPPNPDLLRKRLVKESVHELGHVLGLRHCLDWQCVMASTHDVERLDLKGDGYCQSCLAAASLQSPPELTLLQRSGDSGGFAVTVRDDRSRSDLPYQRTFVDRSCIRPRTPSAVHARGIAGK